MLTDPLTRVIQALVSETAIGCCKATDSYTDRKPQARLDYSQAVP